MQEDLDIERESILKAAKLHWAHWVVVTLSLILTFSAWYFSKNQIEEKIKAKFDHQVAGIIELVKERMQIYEGGLWGGVAAVSLNGGNVDNIKWLKFANSLEIEKKYPGISGIGIIHKVMPNQMTTYLKEQRKNRPAYVVHPKHGEKEFWPITLVEPVSTNKKAVGLDMAHETNRFTAAKKSRDTGAAQITGPIVLVQDSGKTAGFLFYTPFYHGGTYATVEQRQENFAGLVYAPFIVKRLMEGALQKTKRQIGFSITDSGSLMYNEHNEEFEDFDDSPLFKTSVDLEFYGRKWTFDLRSAKSFRAASTSNQPFIILFGGIAIDTLLLILFILLSKSNQRAIGYAERVTDKLKKSNIELEQFSYRTSHDLLAPLKSIVGLTRFAEEDCASNNFNEVSQNIGKTQRLAGKLILLVNDIMDLSKADNLEEENNVLDLDKIEIDIRERLTIHMEESGVKLTITNELSSEHLCQATRLTQVLENLISNGVKYCNKNKTERFVEVEATEENGYLRLTVRDNGLGIPSEYKNEVFSMFKRFHPKVSFGSGLGLYLVKKHVDYMNGSINFTSSDSGTTFEVVLNSGKVA